MPPTWVLMTAGADTQPAHVQYNGRVVGVPSGTNIGSGPTSPGILPLGNNILIYGYPRPTQAVPPVTGVTLDFVMGAALSAAGVDAIRDWPSSGWLDTGQRQIVRQQVRNLITDYGLPESAALAFGKTIHDAAVANDRLRPV